MTESNGNQINQPIDKQQSAHGTKPEYREISEDELKHILEDHKKWLESDGKEGTRADLVGTDLQKEFFSSADLRKAFLINANLQNANLNSSSLQKASLEGADLQNAQLSGADLEHSHLLGANLQGANLYGADLQNANLFGANLQSALLSEANLQNADLSKADVQNAALNGVRGLNQAKNLQYANFHGATGLLGNEFAQADVTGTKLPDNIKDFKALEIVEQTSQNARKIFFATLLGCAYSWLTIATTTDVRLLTNTTSSPLPIIGTEIPIVSFYWTSPFVLLGFYFYLHFYLQRLWENLAGLPAIFPDGRRLDQLAYPWLLNGIVRRHFKRLRDRSRFAIFEEWVTIFLAWWSVPLTLIGFWLRYLPRHEWIGTGLHMGLLLTSIICANYFYSLTSKTLRGGFTVISHSRIYGKVRRVLKSLAIVFIVIIQLTISDGAINGIGWGDWDALFMPSLTNHRELVPELFERLGFSTFADFRGQSVSTKPSNYWEISVNERLQSIRGADLRKKNLRYADMQNAFLVNASLQNGDFHGADLEGAELYKANLSEAILSKATLRSANLEQAVLQKAMLQQARLQRANLKKAKLQQANLQKANLSDAILQQANLKGADLKKADLTGANLQQAHLVSAKFQEAVLERTDFRNADLGHAVLKQANLKKANLKDAKLQQADFEKANLEGADLRGANLSNANLERAKLQLANLEGAYLNAATLRGANLHKANLKNADLQFSNIADSNLQQANLEGADLLGIKNLTIEQLQSVKTLYKAILDRDLREQIEREQPHLLEKPKVN